MRSLFIASVALVICSSTLVSQTVYTKRKSNALREGAGSYYGLVGSVPENTPLKVVARSGSWVKVRLPGDKSGWIAENSLRPEMNQSIPPASPEAMWSSPRALSAAIKSFGKSYVKGAPGLVDTVLAYSVKGFTEDDLAAFTKQTRQSPSGNRDRIRPEDLKLPPAGEFADLREQQVGAGVAARLAGKGIAGGMPLHRYVNLICAAVAEKSVLYDADLTVLVLNDRTINAYAVPGGYIVLTLGLVMQCRDESELAGVIAHELAHIERRHGLQEVSKRIAGIRADMAFSELEAEVGEMTEDEAEMEELANRTYEKLVHPRLLSYEIEADRIGAILAANAGYDPFGLVRISERVARVSKETPDIFDPEYMLPDDAATRAGDIRAFSEKHFTSESPGERMAKRFAGATSSLR
jgi:uncharacterized protein YgiM (DUF1202 family)